MGKKWLAAAGGVGVGLLNGLFGAGGGMVTVPLLELLGVRGKRSHATSLAVIVPLSFVSAWLYWRRGWFSPWELLGAWAGAALLPRLNTAWVKAAFGLLLLWASWRLLLGG